MATPRKPSDEFWASPRRAIPMTFGKKIMKTLALLSCLTLVIGCRSTPKSARAINGADGRALFLAIAEYSDANGQMPPNLFVLDFSAFKTGEHQTTIADLMSVSSDRKVSANFLYFSAPQRLDEIDPLAIVIASPFPGTTTENRFIVRANGSSEFLSEVEFQKAMKNKRKKPNKAEMATPRKPSD
jgi:hypothetical protein